MREVTDFLRAAVWREVSRHLEIAESGHGLLQIVRQELDVSVVGVRRWIAARSELDTVVLAEISASAQRPTRTGLSTPKREELLEWAARSLPTTWLAREHTGLGRLVVPEGVAGPAAAAPLSFEHGFEGVLFVAGRDAEKAIALLQEPMAVALANDARLHELARLREAAESDRRALLARLDRQDVAGAIVGAETGLREVMQRIGQVAATDAPVLILGETGTGKEVAARAIHTQSRRADGPFLRVNCGAIPSELMDSELFGHEKGSFTGAIGLRKGWFERADGGTLFLDEIGELPAAAQVRLLRVLQDGTFQRVGGQESHVVDVRIVAATHRELGAMVSAGRFREDLWYRISVFPLRLPALRERRGDIPLLARHFAERAGMRLYGRPLFLSDEDLAELVAYDWPGNVRELAAVIERAAILGGGSRLDVSTALGVLPKQDAHAQDVAVIADALRRTHGRIEGPFGAARILGVNPHTLRARMRKLGIDWAKYREQR